MTSPRGTWSRFNQVAETSLYDDLSILRGRKHTDDYYRLGDTNFYSKGIIPLVFILPDLRPGDAVIKFQYLRNRKYITRVLDIRNFMTNLSRVYFQRKKKKKERENFSKFLRSSESNLGQHRAWASNPASWVGKKMRSAITGDSSFVELYINGNEEEE